MIVSCPVQTTMHAQTNQCYRSLFKKLINGQISSVKRKITL